LNYSKRNVWENNFAWDIIKGLLANEMLEKLNSYS